MSYRPDFYKPENIIGYTGNADLNPTVYFETGQKPGVQQFGHITQIHNLGRRTDAEGEVLTEGANVGREAVRSSTTYERRVGPTGNLEEWDHGARIHPSRNPFVPANHGDRRTMYLLSCAIARFTEKKSWGDYSKAQRREIRRHGYFQTTH